MIYFYLFHDEKPNIFCRGSLVNSPLMHKWFFKEDFQLLEMEGKTCLKQVEVRYLMNNGFVNLELRTCTYKKEQNWDITCSRVIIASHSLNMLYCYHICHSYLTFIVIKLHTKRK